MNDVDRLINIGRAKHILSELLDHDRFQDLSKHNLWFDSDPTGEKMETLRMELGYINEQLCEMWALIHDREENI